MSLEHTRGECPLHFLLVKARKQSIANKHVPLERDLLAVELFANSELKSLLFTSRFPSRKRQDRSFEEVI